MLQIGAEYLHRVGPFFGFFGLGACGDLPAISAHIVVDDSCFHDGHVPRLLDQLQACLARHFDVEHSTFQLEAAGHAGHEPGTH